MKAIGSTPNEYKNHCTTLTNKFKERSYSESLLKNEVTKVKTINRKDPLSSKESSKVTQMPYETTCHPRLPKRVFQDKKTTLGITYL